MDFRRMGGSGLKVSEIGLGCNNFGMRIDQDQTTAVVEAALEAGIDFFDTADVYGGSQSEVMLGKALGSRRADVLIATKFAMPMGSPRMKGGSRSYVISAIDASLKRLGTDYVDLYQMHAPDAETPIEETLDALDDIVRAGKARYVGCSNFSGWQIADADWTARTRGRVRFISAQNNFSLLERNVEREVLPACDRFGLGLLPYFPLASGLLSGKYHRGEPAPEGTRLSVGGRRAEQALSDRNFDRLERLAAWAAEHGHSLLDLAFAWLLSHKEVPSVIAGATRPEQVKANAAAATWKLTPGEAAEVAALAK
ncbi:MAG TPA: aldo/keto reductase [Caulobacteraceae bacterium]|jgi:aryl-alcohol dehydrogenase-like predicted oxidoreductase